MYEDNSCTCRDCMAGYFINSETGMCEECNPRPDCTALVPNTCDCQPVSSSLWEMLDASGFNAVPHCLCQ